MLDTTPFGTCLCISGLPASALLLLFLMERYNAPSSSPVVALRYVTNFQLALVAKNGAAQFFVCPSHLARAAHLTVIMAVECHIGHA